MEDVYRTITVPEWRENLRERTFWWYRWAIARFNVQFLSLV
jgi:hypothetical protein